MTEITGIRTGVANQKYHPRPRSRFAPHSSIPGTLPYKRRILDRWTERIRAIWPCSTSCGDPRRPVPDGVP